MRRSVPPSDVGEGLLVSRLRSELQEQRTRNEELQRLYEELLQERAADMREAAARVRREAAGRRRAELDAHTNETRFRALVEHSSDLIVVIDAEARITYCSPSVTGVAGYSPDELLGRVADDLIVADDRVAVAALRNGAAGEDERQRGTLRIRAKDGAIRWVEWSSADHLDDPEIGGIIVSVRDVTDRVRAARDLQDSESRYRVLAEASPDLIYTVGADLRARYVNRQAAAAFGSTPEALVGHSLADLFGPHAASITTAVEGVLASGAPYEAESPIWYPDGTRWMRTRLVALRDEDGAIIQILGMSHDITDTRAVRDALVESERRYRSLFEDSPVAMWEEDHSAVKARLEELVAQGVTDIAGYLHEHPDEYRHCVGLVRVLDVNRAAVELWQAESRDELRVRGNDVYELDHVSGLPGFWAGTLVGRRTAHYEDTGVTLKGTTMHTIETCIVAPGSEESLAHVYIANVDIGEQRRSRELLQRYRLLFAEARDIMWFVRADDGRIVEANAATEAAYGYSREELLELTLADLRCDGDGALLAEQLKQAGASGVLFETEHRRKDGSVFPVEVSSRGITTIEGETLLLSVIRDIGDRRRTQAELVATTARLERTVEAVVAALGAASELRDPYTAGHQKRVAELAGAIAADLGWDEPRIAALRTAALLHDLGKMVVPAEILSKPGRLNDTEFQLIRQHAAAGSEILADIDFGADVADVVRHHHERLDGSGYPDGLSDEQITPEARVLAVADVVEAMVSHRPYRPSLPLETALAEIEEGSGVRYDAEVCAACARLFREGRFVFVPPGE